MRRSERFAVSRLHLPTGEVLKNQVVERCEDPVTHAVSCRYYPLTEEVAFTEWRGGEYYLSDR